jgi:hypothetical protein
MTTAASQTRLPTRSTLALHRRQREEEDEEEEEEEEEEEQMSDDEYEVNPTKDAYPFLTALLAECVRRQLISSSMPGTPAILVGPESHLDPVATLVQAAPSVTLVRAPDSGLTDACLIVGDGRRVAQLPRGLRIVAIVVSSIAATTSAATGARAAKGARGGGGADAWLGAALELGFLTDAEPRLVVGTVERTDSSGASRATPALTHAALAHLCDGSVVHVARPPATLILPPPAWSSAARRRGNVSHLRC